MSGADLLWLLSAVILAPRLGKKSGWLLGLALMAGALMAGG